MQPRLALLANALFLAFSGTHAVAQTASQSPSEKELPAVVVTGEQARSYKSDSVQVGTFRDMAPIDVPLTNNVVTREVIDAQAVTTIFGAVRNTAGVTRSQLSGSTYDNIAIRGILVENRGNYRLNGSLPIINLIDVPLENKERVEVLKGVSSLYYGLVPPSGIVNLVTKRAGKDPVTSLALSGNHHGAATAHADIGRRFGSEGQFGARINLLQGREDIGINNFSGDRSLASAAFDFKATRALSFKLDLEHYRKDVSEQAAIQPVTAGGRVILPPVPDNKQNLAGEWQKYDAQATNILFRTDYALSQNWGVMFEAGKAETKRDRRFSQFEFGTTSNLATGSGNLRVFFNDGQEFENENYRGELYGRLPGSFLTHELSLGYTSNERDGLARAQGVRTTPQNYYRPGPVPVLTAPGPNASNPSSIEDKGWYVFDRMSFGEQWQAMVGARGGRYKIITPARTSENDEISPMASVMYKPRQDLSLYASYIEGREDSGQAPANRANGGEILEPGLSRQKEIGMKAEVAQGLLFQAAYFDIERASATVDGANRFVLNGTAEYKGLEFVATGELTRQLSLIGSALFMDAEQQNRNNASTFGKTPNNTPGRTGSLFAEYRLVAVPGLAVSGGAIYVGERPVDDPNTAYVGGYTTLSVGARYATRLLGNKTTLQAVLDNATDRDYWSTAGNGLIGVGAPRTLKVAARIDF